MKPYRSGRPQQLLFLGKNNRNWTNKSIGSTINFLDTFQGGSTPKGNQYIILFMATIGITITTRGGDDHIHINIFSRRVIYKPSSTSNPIPPKNQDTTYQYQADRSWTSRGCSC